MTHSGVIASSAAPDVVYRADSGEYVVIWQQVGDIYSRGVLPDGSLAGSATAVANTAQSEAHPRLASDAQGLLAIWQRQSSGSGADLYARPLDASGVPSGETFTVQETAGNQQNPALAYGANQRTQLAWQDDREGGWDLYTAVPDRSYQVTHIQYSYDPLYRLTKVTYSGDIAGTYAYAHDALGNRTTYTATITSTVVTTYTYNAVNQLTTAKADNSADIWYYAYDGNGNQVRQVPNGLIPTSGEIRTTFDQRSRLIQVENHDGSGYQLQAEAVYDGQNNRLQTISHLGDSPVVVTYPQEKV